MEDRLHKWIVLTTAMLVMWLSFGFIFQFGVYFIPMSDKYGASRSQTALVQSLLMGCTLCVAVFSGLLCARFGHGKVFAVGAMLMPLGTAVCFFSESIITLQLCIGICTGTGVSLVFISCTVTINKVFEGPTRLLALSLIAAAGGVAGLTHPFIIQWLLDTYGLNGSFLLLGGIFLNDLPAAIVFWNTGQPSIYKPSQPLLSAPLSVDADKISDEYNSLSVSRIQSTEGQLVSTLTRETAKVYDDQHSLLEETEENGDVVVISHLGKTTDVNKQQSIGNTLRLLALNCPYILFIIGACICIAPINGYQSLVLDIYRWKGYSRKQGLMSYFAFNTMSTVARVIPGLVKQRRGVNSLILPIGFAFSGLLGQMVILAAESYSAMMVGSAVCGIGIGGVVASATVVVNKLVPEECFSVAVGIVNTLTGTLTVLSGPVFGTMRDHLKTYTHVLVLTAAVELVGAVMFGLSLFIRYQQRHKVRKDTDI